MKRTLLLITTLLSFSCLITNGQTTILSEDFEGGALPSGWTSSQAGGSNGWEFGNSTTLSSQYWNIPAHTNLAASNDDNCNCDAGIDYLITPSMDLTSYGGAVIQFAAYFDGAYGSTAHVRASTDGGNSWNLIGNLTGDATGWQTVQFGLTSYASSSTVTVVFHHDDNGGWSSGFAIDDVLIYEPFQFDVGVSDITMQDYTLLSSGDVFITGVITNYGSTTITSVDLTWTIDGGSANTETLTGLNISTLDTYSFTHTIKWTPASTGIYTLDVSTSNPNGNTDSEPTNDNFSFVIAAVNQTVQRIPLYENFTSSTCPPCVGANSTMLSLFGKNPDAGANAGKWSLVKYQMSWPGIGDPYYTTEGGTRRAFYGINSVPRVEIDGEWDLNGASLTQAVIDDYYDNPSFLDISSTFTISGQTVDVDVTINPVADITSYASTNMVLHVAILEKETYNNINSDSNGETEFQFVMKKMVPNANGTSVGPFTSGIPVTVNQSYTFNGSYILPPDASAPVNHAVAHTVEEFSDLTVVVWVQDMTSKNVHQSAWSQYTCGIASTTTVNADCGSQNGSATASTTAGISPFTYAWDDANTQTTATAAGLLAGIYDVTVTDALGCILVAEAIVNNNGAPTTVVSQINNSCSDGTTGQINMSVSGGTPNYTFLWSNGSSTEDINGLANGSYLVTITDASGCQSFASASITSPDPIVATETITSETLPGNGAINLMVSGGTPNYVFSWDNGATTQSISGLIAGNYSVTITDGFQCTITGSYNVPLAIGIVTANASEFEFNIYPNPFVNSTTVEFTLKKEEFVNISVYNILGEIIYSAENRTFSAGQHNVEIDAQNMTTGIYFVDMKVGSNSYIKKVINKR